MKREKQRKTTDFFMLFIRELSIFLLGEGEIFICSVEKINESDLYLLNLAALCPAWVEDSVTPPPSKPA